MQKRHDEMASEALESVQKGRTTLELHICTQPFNGPLSRTTWVSRYQKGTTNLDFTEARDSERVAVVSAGPYASLHLAPDR